MKKILFLSAAAAALSLVSCQKDDSPSPATDSSQQEITAVNVALTKGYVEGAVFEDTPYDTLHATSVKKPRYMYMSAFHTPQDKQAVSSDYFVGKKFQKDTSPTDNDGLWHTYPKVYWPLGGTLDFLAYSTTKDFEARNVTWNASDASSEVVLYVSDDYTQDDILYAGSTGKKYNTSDTGASPQNGNVALQFGHAQAWIQFQLNTNVKDVIHINKITLEKIYKQGELIIAREDGEDNGATAEWSFRGEISGNADMDDTYKVTATDSTLTTNVKYMDMLIPEQAKTAFVIEYVLAGQPDKALTYRYDLTEAPTTANWEMGHKYVYKVNCQIYEMTVTPTVTVFESSDFAENIDPAN